MGNLLPGKLYSCWNYGRNKGIRVMAKTAKQAVEDLYPGAEVVWSHGSATYSQAVYVVTRQAPDGRIIPGEQCDIQFSVTVREVTE